MAKPKQGCYGPIGIQYAWAVKFDGIKRLPDIIYVEQCRFQGDISLDTEGEVIPLTAENLSLVENVNNGKVSSKLTGFIDFVSENNSVALDDLSREQLIIFMYDNNNNMRVMGDSMRGCRMNFDSLDEGNQGNTKGQPIQANFLSDHLCPWYTGFFTINNEDLILPSLPISGIAFEEYFGETSGKYKYSLITKQGNGDELTTGGAKLVAKNKETGVVIDTLTGSVGSAISASAHTYGGTSIKGYITGDYSDGEEIYFAYRDWIHANGLYMSRMPEIEFIFTVDAVGCESNPSTAFLTLPKGINSMFSVAQMAGVWGFRKIVDTYTGFLCRVKNKSTNVETDIGFGTNGFLDMVALESAAGASHLVVAKIYEQSGNGVDFIQTDVTKMPFICDNGVPIVDYRAGYTVGCATFATIAESPDSTIEHQMIATNLSLPADLSSVAVWSAINFANQYGGLYYSLGPNAMQCMCSNAVNISLQTYYGPTGGTPKVYNQWNVDAVSAAGSVLLTEQYYKQSTTTSENAFLPSTNKSPEPPIVTESGRRRCAVTNTGVDLSRTVPQTITITLFKSYFGYGNLIMHEWILLNDSALHLTKDAELREHLIETYTI